MNYVICSTSIKNPSLTIEYFMLKDTQSCNTWQVLPEATVEVIAELAEWTPSQELDEKA